MTQPNKSRHGSVHDALEAAFHEVQSVTDRNVLLKIGITCCIEHDANTRGRIVGILRRHGFHHGHVVKILETSIGDLWRRDDAGTYHNLFQPGAGA